MKNRQVLALVGMGFAAGLAGCGETDGGAWQAWADAEGVYRIDAMTLNAAACDAEGASTLMDTADHLAVFRGSDAFGSWIQAMGCGDPAACRTLAQAIRARTPVSYAFSYNFRTATEERLQGMVATTGWSGRTPGQCTEAELTNLVLTRPTDGQLRVEVRSVVVDHPADAQGICWTDDTEKAAAGKPCGKLEVVAATRLEAL